MISTLGHWGLDRGRGLKFCSVGPPGLISMLPGTVGQKQWAGAGILLSPPTTHHLPPPSSPLFASNREGLCAVGRKAVVQHLYLHAEELGGVRHA